MRIFLSPPHQNGLEADYLREALSSNYLAPAGPMLEKLESFFRAFSGQNFALATQSGTAAIQLAVRHLADRRHPREDPRPPLVLASTLSFIASVAPALQMGCEVRLLDAEPESWTLDPVLLSHAITEAHAEDRQVLTVIPTDLYGQRADLQAVIGLCEPAGIPVLCDAAESLGATDTPALPRKPWATIHSFNGNKIVTGSAGGVLLTDDEQLAGHALKLSTQAREPTAHYEHRELGYNTRMSNLLAAVVLAQLQNLEERVEQRRRIFAGYAERLEDLPGISLMPEAAWNRHSRWLTVMLVDEDAFGAAPEEIRLALEAGDIESRPMWKPLHLQPVLRGVRCYQGGVSEDLFHRGLCLPSGHHLTDDDLDRICGIIRNLQA